MRSLRDVWQTQSIELLAPAGSLDAARAAVNAGADAIYMGGPLFSARAYAESAGTDMLKEAVSYCHLRGVRVYMTLNTLMKEAELSTLYSYLKPYAELPVDAVIVQDLGVLRFVREHFPALPVHASTQMTVTGPYFVAYLRSLGVSRIVPARELSLSEIRAIHEQVDIEIETFIHGALCYAYSGQCLMSSMLGGRSGNRGRCAGPCRLPYEVLDEHGRRLFGGKKDGYVLSMKDLNTLSSLSALSKAGVSSLKIEGRMRPPLYVAAVTSVYRKYLDLGMPREIREEDRQLLSEASARAADTKGYLDVHNGPEMLMLREKEERRGDSALLSSVKERFLNEDLRVPVCAEAVFRKGAPAELRLTVAGGKAAYGAQKSLAGLSASARSVYPDRSVLAEAAKSQALSAERIREALLKFGGTPFSIEALSLSADPDLFFPVREINELRRKAADELKKTILDSFRRD